MFTAKVTRKKHGRGFAGLKSVAKGPDAVKVGFPAGKSDGDLIAIASYNEFGTRHIPERPALRNAIRDNRASYGAAMASSAARIFRVAAEGGDAGGEKRKVLGRLGAKVQGDMQAEITALQSPPNAPNTIRQKGSSNPLIDTGRLRASVSWQIVEGGGIASVKAGLLGSVSSFAK